MKIRKKIILSSILSICLCVSLIAGATFALFTSESKVDIAVTSGTVKVEATASITKLYSAEADNASGTLFDENGMKYNQVEVDPINHKTWTNGGTAVLNGGGLTLTNITPGDKVEFDIALKNKSNVKIQYRTVVMLNEKGESIDDIKALAKALVICKDGDPICSGNYDPEHNIIYNDPLNDKFYSPWTKVYDIPTDEEIAAGGAALGTDGIISMSVELPLTAGNTLQEQDLQGQNCTLYFLVEAVQFNANTVDESNETFAKNDLEALNAKLHTSEDDKNPTMFDALTKAAELFAEGGALHDLKDHLVGKIGPDMTAVENGYEFAWDSVNDRFIYMRGTTPIYPTDEDIPENYQIFKVKNTFWDDDGYSVYVQTNYTVTPQLPLPINAGFDVGNNTGDFKIEYDRHDATDGRDVVIRTNSLDTTLTVEAPNDTIKHYGINGYLNIIKADLYACYHEFGYSKAGEATYGRIVNHKGEIEVEGETKETGVAFLYINTKEADGDVFDDVIVAAADGASLPEFDRPTVNIADGGTLVLKVEQVTGTNETLDSEEYIYLWKSGVKEQIVVTETPVEALVINTDTGKIEGNNGEAAVIGSDNVERGATSKAAEEIANLAKRNNEGELVDDNDDIIDVSKPEEIAVEKIVEEERKSKEEVIKEKTAKAAAKINGKYCKTYEEAFEAMADSGVTIIVANDNHVFEKNIVCTIKKGQELIFDLNGYKLDQIAPYASVAYFFHVENGGKFTLMDSKGTGEITQNALLCSSGNNVGKTDANGKAVAFDMTWGSPSYASTVVGVHGSFIMMGGTLHNITDVSLCGQGGACYAIDTYSGGVTQITGGTMIADVCTSVRLALFSETAETQGIITGGYIRGGYFGVQIQNFNTSANIGSLTISGGKFETTDTYYELCVYAGFSFTDSDMTGVKPVKITGGEFMNTVAFSENIPEANLEVSGGTFHGQCYSYNSEAKFITAGSFYLGEAPFYVGAYKKETYPNKESLCTWFDIVEDYPGYETTYWACYNNEPELDNMADGYKLNPIGDGWYEVVRK